MNKQNQIETIKAHFNDCINRQDRFLTLKMFMEDKEYDPANIHEALRDLGLKVTDVMLHENIK